MGDVFPFPGAIRTQVHRKKQTKANFCCVYCFFKKENQSIYTSVLPPLPQLIPRQSQLPTWLFRALAVLEGVQERPASPNSSRGGLQPPVSNTACTKDTTWERDPWLQGSPKTTDVANEEGTHTRALIPPREGAAKALSRRCSGGPPPTLLAKVQGSH